MDADRSGPNVAGSEATLAGSYDANGYVGGVPILSESDAASYRRNLEIAEATLGSLHYLDKIQTLLWSPYELCVHPAVLDAVEACIGPNILLYNATFIIKEPGSDAHVAWHQDLTYWGLSDDDAQVSMWLALAPATAESGCMQFLPGSHRLGSVPHVLGSAEPAAKTNVLLQDQHVDETALTDLHPESGQFCPLAPGEASFHHGWTLHSSPPNRSADRRIGLNVQYLAPQNTTGQSGHTARLVRGTDEFGHYAPDPLPFDCQPADLSKESISAWRDRNAAMKAGFVITPSC